MSSNDPSVKPDDPIRRPLKKTDNAGELAQITDVQPKPLLEYRDEDDWFDPRVLAREEAKSRRWGWVVFVVGFLGFMVWAFWAPLEQGAMLHSAVEVVGNTKDIQHQAGGVIDDILVKESDQVKKGDILVKLNPIRSTADLEANRTQWIAAKATEARLLAELTGNSNIVFPEWFARNPEDPRVISNQDLQRKLFESRRRTVNSEISALRERIEVLESALVEVRLGLENQEAELAIAEERMRNQRELEAKGFVSRNQLAETERDVARLRSAMSNTRSNLLQTQGQIAENKLTIARRQAEYNSTVQSELAAAATTADELSSRLTVTEFDSESMLIRSPIDGYVANIQVNTIGGVINPGQVILSVVPTDAELQLVGKLPAGLINRVNPGMPVEVAFSALSATQTPVIQGSVKTVSADAIEDPHTGQSYYKVQIELGPDQMEKLSKYEITPGLPAEAFVKEGERSLMNYMFKPLIDRLHYSLTEH